MIIAREDASSSDQRDLWFLDTRVVIRVSYQDGADNISVLEHWAAFHDGPPLHVHQREDEVFQVLAGEVRFRVGDREQMARAGDILLVPQGTPHTYRVESPECAHFLTVTCGLIAVQSNEMDCLTHPGHLRPSKLML